LGIADCGLRIGRPTTDVEPGEVEDREGGVDDGDAVVG
jgi:hypothetical protein